MKKIFLALLLAVAACMPRYDKAPVLKDYAEVPLMELPVSRISIASQVSSAERYPHVEQLMPMSPEKSLKSWALVRLRPNYQKPMKADFIIKEASMIQEEAPEESFFTYDNYKYTLKYAVELQIKNTDNTVARTVEVSGFTSRKLPQKAAVEQRDNMFTQMLLDMEDELDKQMEEQIKQNLLDL